MATVSTIRLRNWGDLMYLSRIRLDTKNRQTMLALNSPNLFHGAIEASYEGERKRTLWRIDSLNGDLYVLLQSENEPDLTAFCEQFGYRGEAWETKNYDDFLSGIKCGSRWRFRITANPTKSVSKGSSDRGTVHAHITVGHQKEWLIKKGEVNGFSVDEDSFNVTGIKWLKFNKRDRKNVTLLSVAYEGILEVIDPDLFRNAILSGIGRGKAYGMGLMTLMSCR